MKLRTTEYTDQTERKKGLDSALPNAVAGVVGEALGVG